MKAFKIRLAPLILASEMGPQLAEAAAELTVYGDAMRIAPSMGADDYLQIILGKDCIVFCCSMSAVSYCLCTDTQSAKVLTIAAEGDKHG